MSYTNPYQLYGQPPSYGGPGQFGPPPVNPTKINAPAIGLIAVGAINLLQSLYGLVRNLSGMNVNNGLPPNINDNPAVKEIYDAFAPYSSPSMSLSAL